jgi:hypothetical protein
VSVRRRQRKLARWEAETRIWATDMACSVALDLYRYADHTVRPYGVGVVLEQDEKPWVQVPARCSADWSMPTRANPRRGDPPPLPPFTDWLVTSQRVVGRLFGNVIRRWYWRGIVGARIDLTPGSEFVQLDPAGKPPVIWTGPGVGPLAVAAVYHLHGATAMIDHPGLAPLRREPTPTKEAGNPAPPVRGIEPAPPLRL